MRLNRYLNEAREMLKDWLGYIKLNKELFAAVDVLKIIEKKRYQAFLVGGAVRDIIIGNLKLNDVDITTNMPIDELEKIFKTHDIGKSKSFGIVVINHKGHSFEIAQFRSDGKYKDGRRPEKVSFNVTLEDDLGRRDLTINALAIDKDGKIIDKFGGKRAIQNRVLKTVGNPYKRFSEDFLRMMRVARFSAKLGFSIDKETKKAIKKLSPNILKLSPERLKDELLKTAKESGDKFADYILILDELKLLRFILPALKNLQYWKENLVHHPETRGKGGTVFAHTIAALRKVKADQPIAMVATALHDIGKGVSFSQKNGLPRYLGHAKRSMDLVDEIADKLKMSNKERKAIIFAVGNHMKFHNILDMKASKIAKLVSDDNWDILTIVAKADETARGEAFRHAGEFEKIVDKAIKIKERVGSKELERRFKLVDGNAVMKLTGLKPSKEVGKIIRKVTEWILDNNINNEKDIEEKIMNIYKEIN